MPTIGLFYASTGGATAQIALRIQRHFAVHYQQPVELLDIAEFLLEEMLAFDCLLLGVSTWNVGQLQKDWEAVFEEFESLDLSGKRIAVFGLGDQVDYPDTFVDALFFVADKAVERGASLVGHWPINGYHFRQSWAMQDGRFVGLVLDEINQPELSDKRIAVWVAQLQAEGFNG